MLSLSFFHKRSILWIHFCTVIVGSMYLGSHGMKNRRKERRSQLKGPIKYFWKKTLGGIVSKMLYSPFPFPFLPLFLFLKIPLFRIKGLLLLSSFLLTLFILFSFPLPLVWRISRTVRKLFACYLASRL